MKSRVETPVTYASPCAERDQAMAKINAGVAAILEPRSGFFVGPAGKHFLRTPSIPRDEKGNERKPDSPEMNGWRKELQRITREEQRLVSLAESAKSALPHLEKWSRVIHAWEEGFEIASQAGALIDGDLGDLGMLKRAHERFMRTANQWVARLKY